jgi:hypothetical protein
MTANYLLPGSPTTGRYLGVVVLDVVRGERVLGYVMFSIVHVRAFMEECRLTPGRYRRYFEDT